MAVMHPLLLEHLGALNGCRRESKKGEGRKSIEWYVKENDLKKKRNGEGNNRGERGGGGVE